MKTCSVMLTKLARGIVVVVLLDLATTVWAQSLPVTPTPVTPTPITPTPITPTPITPTPVTPTPITPTPITPTPITPTPITSTTILPPPEPRLPDAIDSDGDKYLDFAEDWYGSDPHNALDCPTDMTPQQANFNPDALKWYQAGWGRLNITPVDRNSPPPKRMGFSNTASKSLLKPAATATATPAVSKPAPGLSGGDAALLGLGVAGAVGAGVVLASAASGGGLFQQYQCSDGYSWCSDGACCPTHYLGNGLYGSYHFPAGCIGSVSGAANYAAHTGIVPAGCADERRNRNPELAKTMVGHTLRPVQKK